MKTPDLITDTVGTLGPNARAMLASAPKCMTCGHGIGPHEDGDCQFISNGIFGDRCGCRRFSMPPLPVRQPSPRPTVVRLIADIAAGIRVLVTRDKLDIPEELIMERARNTAAGIVGNYNVTGMGE